MEDHDGDDDEHYRKESNGESDSNSDGEEGECEWQFSLLNTTTLFSSEHTDQGQGMRTND